MNWYHRKVEESNLWDLELNAGFDRFKLDGRVFSVIPCDIEKIFYLLFKAFEQFY